MPEDSQFKKLKHKPLVLFSPLDWGYGHTTRSIPIIAHFHSLNCSVVVACTEAQERVLSSTFPLMEFVRLPSVRIIYGKNRMRTRIRLFGQIPSFLWGIRRERLWLKKFESTRKVSLVISDNRYGFYSSTAPSVLITHQLNIRSGFGKAIDRLMNYLNLRLMKHFFECWVPDFMQAPGLSGDLGHPRRIPDIPVRYIGCLSRFTPCEQQKNEHILIVLSGPEPQRSIFEQLLLDQLSGITEKLFFVRGVDISSPLPDVPSHVTLMNFASSAQLNDLVCRARFVVARCGYTTVMDLFKTKQKGILIPTPGQPEQEYLARHLHASRLAYTVDQKKFNLYESINAASDFDYRIFEGNMNEYKNVIDAFAERIL